MTARYGWVIDKDHLWTGSQWGRAMTNNDLSGRYRVAGSPVAWFVMGYARRWVADEMWVVDDDGYDVLVETGDGEWVRDPDRVIVVMVGDDREHVVDIGDLTALNDDDYCTECGQIGCTADGRDRDNDNSNANPGETT